MNYKFKELLFKYNNHYEKNTVITDSFLRSLAELVTDGALTIQKLKDRLTNPSIGQSTGNYIQVIHENDYVLIGSQFDEDDELDKIKISKEKLIKFIEDWQEAIKDNPDEITLCRDDNFNIWIETSKT